MNKQEWLNFGETVRRGLLIQAKYAARYVGGLCGSPNLGSGLRFREQGEPVSICQDFRTLEIFADDAPEFLKRVKAHRYVLLSFSITRPESKVVKQEV